MRVAKVEAVATVGDNGGVEGLGLPEHGSGELEEVLGRAVDGHGVLAVSAAEGDVAVTGDDLHGTSEGVGSGGGSADGEQLAEGGGLAVHGAVLEHLGVKVAGREEVDVDADAVAGRNIADVVLALEGVDGADGDKVAAEGEQAEEAGGLAETGEDNGVRDVRVQGGQAVGHGGAKGVADVDLVLEAVLVHAAQVAVVYAHGQLVQGLDLGEELDLVDRVAVRRVGNAQAVPGERRVALLDGAVDVAVVVVVERVVPVTAVEADTVRQDLDGVAGARGGRAIGGGQLVLLLNGVILFPDKLLVLDSERRGKRVWCLWSTYAGEELVGVVGTGLGELEEEVGRVNLVVRGRVVKDAGAGLDVDGDVEVAALLAAATVVHVGRGGGSRQGH